MVGVPLSRFGIYFLLEGEIYMDQAKIGEFIAEMRKHRGLTQRAFAEILGISDKAVSKWETGNGMPDVSIMLDLCKVLEIDLNELFSGERLTDINYKAKAEENILRLIKESNLYNRNIVGGETIGHTENMDLKADAVHRTNTAFWDTAGNEWLGEISLPNWGSFLPSEDKLNLLGDLVGKRVLEIGCGNGQSLIWSAEHGTADLWGLDISPQQIKKAEGFLKGKGISAKLFCSPMEKECGLPANYFDVVYSVFGLGWTTDLNSTLKLINSYLINGGVFVFSWSHPIHKCVSVENGNLIFCNSYFNENWYCGEIGNEKIALSNRMLGTYINALTRNGFTIEQIVEETDEEKAKTDNSDFSRKALMLPTAFIIKARKIN